MLLTSLSASASTELLEALCQAPREVAMQYVMGLSENRGIGEAVFCCVCLLLDCSRKTRFLGETAFSKCQPFFGVSWVKGVWDGQRKPEKSGGKAETNGKVRKSPEILDEPGFLSTKPTFFPNNDLCSQQRPQFSPFYSKAFFVFFCFFLAHMGFAGTQTKMGSHPYIYIYNT